MEGGGSSRTTRVSVSARGRDLSSKRLQIRLKAWQALPVEETGRSASRAKSQGTRVPRQGQKVKYESFRLKARQALPVEESGDRKVCRVCLKPEVHRQGLESTETFVKYESSKSG